MSNVVKVFYVLDESNHHFDVYFNDDKIVEVDKHFIALEFVRELSFIEEDTVLDVYDETYEIRYSILNGEIISDFDLPVYMECYLDRYLATMDGIYKYDLIVYKDDKHYDKVSAY